MSRSPNSIQNVGAHAYTSKERTGTNIVESNSTKPRVDDKSVFTS